MRAVIQRVTAASVTVAGEVVGQIELGLLVLLGVEKGTLKPRPTGWRRKSLVCGFLRMRRAR